MTNQEIFNKAYKGVVNQGGCAYRGAEGRKCGAGHLILDQYYDKSMEGASIRDESGVLPEQLSLVRHLQYAHDSAAEYCIYGNFIKKFKKKMLGVAREFNLEGVEGLTK